jgi:dTDP-4-amino-4,6-dideoxygalactose transaminase
MMKNSAKIPFARVPVGENELKYVTEVLESGWLTTASKATNFENLFAQAVGARYACAVNSCTAALHLGAEALGIKPGEEVFVQSMTFTASAEVIRYLGAHPVFLDIEYGTNLVTPEILEKAIQQHPDVRYLVLVHYGGQVAEMVSEKGNGILDICKKHSIRIIEDAAHAFPSKLNGRMVGTFGDVTCFSFYANKTITTGEGGMIVTDDPCIYRRVKVMRLHGINRDIWDRYTCEKPSWEYDVIAPGFKYNMPDINAAIGLAQLENAEKFREERQKVAEFYYSEFSGMEMIDLPVCHRGFEEHSWHLFPIVLNENANITRNRFIEKMAEACIGTSVHYKPLHRMTYYREAYNLNPLDYPNTERTWSGNVSLPIYPFMTEEELRRVADAVKKILTVTYSLNPLDLIA